MNFIFTFKLSLRMTSLYTDTEFQEHKQKLVYENSTESHEINCTPLDRRLKEAYDAFDKDDMEINLIEVEHDGYYKEHWQDFLRMVEKVRKKRKERFNEICMKLKDHPGICYQIKNSDGFCFNEIEGLWAVIRGDVWRAANPNIIINNDDVCDTDAVFLQFQDIYTDDYELSLEYIYTDDNLISPILIKQVYSFVKKRYLSIEDVNDWLNLIQKDAFGKNFTTIAIVTCKDANWVPKKYIYYINPFKFTQSDFILEFNDQGKLHSIPLKPTCDTSLRKMFIPSVLRRTILLTNEDCEKYCSLVELTDSKPYALNEFYTKHRTRGYYMHYIYRLEFKYAEYHKYIDNLENIENICVK